MYKYPLLSQLLFYTQGVNIRKLAKPKAGAILDLNSDTKGGLLLSNVVIDDLELIPADFGGVTIPVSGRDNNETLKGTMICHPGGGTNNVPAGVL